LVGTVGVVGSVLGETVNPLSIASLSNTRNDPKFILPYPIRQLQQSLV